MGAGPAAVTPAGYSGTPLAQKLGIKAGDKVVVLNPPWDYESVVAPMPEGVTFGTRVPARARFVHLFVKTVAELKKKMPAIDKALADDGMVWVSWPKKSSGVETDVTEDGIRAVVLPKGLVDVKVCAVDEVWSGLKVVRRVSERRRR
jgi:hypothetical protein